MTIKYAAAMISNVESGTHLPPPRKVQAREKPAHTRFGVAGRPQHPGAVRIYNVPRVPGRKPHLHVWRLQ
jgi:hypothetical protein